MRSRDSIGARFSQPWIGRVVLFALAATCGLYPAAGAAGAFPDQASNSDCDLTSFTYWIDNPGHPGLPSGAVQATQQGMEEWNQVQGLSGQQLIDVNDTSSGIYVHVEFVNDINGSTTKNGATQVGLCADPSKKVLINVPAMVNNGEYRDVARHEIGHVLGLSHTGKDAAVDGPVPTMAACQPANSIARVFSKDDIAAAFFHGTDTSKLDSDPGFESGIVDTSYTTPYWYTQNGSFLTSYSPYQGTREAILPWTGAAISNLVDFNTVGVNYVRAELTYRTEGPVVPNPILVTFTQGNYDYPNASSNCVFSEPNIRYQDNGSWGTSNLRTYRWLPSSSSYQNEALSYVSVLTGANVDSELFKINISHWNSIGHMEVDNVVIKD